MELIDEIFDRESLMQLVGDDVTLLTDMIEMFADTCPPVVERLRAAVAEANQIEIREASHLLKGMTGNFYAGRVRATATEIENVSRQGDLTRTPHLLLRLEDELSELNVALNSLCP